MSSYPSIISQPGSAAKNLQPITEALTPLVEEQSQASGSRRILELASFPFDHILAFAEKWTEVDWYGTCRDDDEANEVQKRFSALIAQGSEPVPNLSCKVLDITIEKHWEKLNYGLAEATQDGLAAFEGVIMPVNLVHCCPEGAPEGIFRHLSPQTESGRQLLNPHTGWIAAYGAYKNDDGTYKSENDKKFEKTHIQKEDASLGLRTVKSISEMAERWGFAEESRRNMPNGNMFIVWRVKTST